MPSLVTMQILSASPVYTSLSAAEMKTSFTSRMALSKDSGTCSTFCMFLKPTWWDRNLGWGIMWPYKGSPVSPKAFTRLRVQHEYITQTSNVPQLKYFQTWLNYTYLTPDQYPLRQRPCSWEAHSRGVNICKQTIVTESTETKKKIEPGEPQAVLTKSPGRRKERLQQKIHLSRGVLKDKRVQGWSNTADGGCGISKGMEMGRHITSRSEWNMEWQEMRQISNKQK